MALTFIDIYNGVAEQAWSMYDADAESVEDFESGLKSSINKALSELWCSYAFPFRIKEYAITTDGTTHKYSMPNGIIYKKTVNGSQRYSVRLVGVGYLEYADNLDTLEPTKGVPSSFQVYNDYIILDTIPEKDNTIIVEYLDLAIGEDSMGDKLYELKSDEDTIDVPEKYEILFKNALITKSMTYAIADKTDENYAGYLEQYENAYKILVQYCIGIDTDKRIIL